MLGAFDCKRNNILTRTYVDKLGIGEIKYVCAPAGSRYIATNVALRNASVDMTANDSPSEPHVYNDVSAIQIADRVVVYWSSYPAHNKSCWSS